MAAVGSDKYSKCFIVLYSTLMVDIVMFLLCWKNDLIHEIPLNNYMQARLKITFMPCS